MTSTSRPTPGSGASPSKGADRSIRQIRSEDIERARERITTTIHRTPLLPLEGTMAPCRIHLKLESLQPIGSFKLRGAANAMALADEGTLRNGVYTASAGNMAQGVAYAARERDVACRVIVPESAPETKIRAIERLGATCVPVPYDRWWSVLQNHGHPDEAGFFIHPVANRAVIAGNGTIGLEIHEDLPDVDAVVVPFGGGGLSCGIASALKAARPDVPVFAAEVDTAAPFAASLRADAPTSIERVPSFVDGIGGSGMLPEMWPLASTLLDGSIVVGLEEVRSAVRLLVRDARVVAEGAGAAALAAALTGAAGEGTVAVVISGGNIDASVLAEILLG